MRICRFIIEQQTIPRYGILEDEQILPFNLGFTFADFERLDYQTEKRINLAQVKLVMPLEPSKIVCVGRNYADHAKELGNEVPIEPLLFLKAPSSLITSGETIVLPAQSNQVEHEGELAVVIKRVAKDLDEAENPLDYVFGYTPLNDVTARDLQRADVQFTRAKSFDTFCPVAKFIETDLDPTRLNLTVRVNGAIKQSGNTAQMVFSVAALIRYISRQMTLLPGDLIATGTPAGVSRLKAGDICEIEIENLGVLSNSVG